MDDHDLLMDAVTDQAMRTKNGIQGSWAWGGLSLLAGGYLVGGFGGALIAFGALWIALAVASRNHRSHLSNRDVGHSWSNSALRRTGLRARRDRR